jgi:hypothetical protein
MMNVEIKHVDIISVMKVCFVIYAIIGIVAGLVFLFVTLVTSGLAGYGHEFGYGGLSRVAATGFGVLMVPLLSLIYGCIGAVAGLIVSAVYNLIARVIGGVKLTMSGDPSGPGTSWENKGTEVRL